MFGKVTFDERVNALEMYWKGDIHTHLHLHLHGNLRKYYI